MNVFIANPEPIGPTYWRRTLPVRHLARTLWEHGVAISYGPRMKSTRHYEAILVNRNLPDPALLPHLIARRRRGSLIVWDMDDDLLHLPPLVKPTMALRKWRAEESALLRACLEVADLITVSTGPLGQACGHPEKTVICPNLIDLNDHPMESDEGPPRDVILYTGSTSHLADLELIRDLYHRTSGRFRWVFYGVRPPWMDRRTAYIPWGTVADYPRVCRLFRPLVCLAPLKPSPFNECKSPIKVWECATFGASVIASNTGPYRGHPAAIVPEGEPFMPSHLDAVLASPNVAVCQHIARANSWQHSRAGRLRWLSSFQFLAAQLAA